MEFKELIKVRRSVRSYEAGRTIEREAIEEILRAALMAPTWKNFEAGRFYIADTPERVEKVKKTCLPEFNQRNCENAPALIVTTFIRDKSGFSKGEPDNEFGNMWGAYDLGLQSAYLILKAADLGLDTLIMGIRDADALRREFSIPENEEIAAVISLGYRKGEPAFPKRNEVAEVARF